ncbi:uroporphyrinogen-III synthase [soil metagenome]
MATKPTPSESTALRKIKTILVSQPTPETGKSPYAELEKKYGLQVDFRQFIQVDGVPGKDFRKDKINISDYSAIILNSRNAIDHLFRVCEELRIKLSQDTKFFCISEAVALYLQKYTQYRKRKVFFSSNREQGLFDLILKHKNNERFLWPCTDTHQDDIPEFMDKHGLKWDKAVMYRTVSADLSDLAQLDYDLIIFFSPLGIKSLFENYPDFIQRDKHIAAMGPVTAEAVKEAGLVLSFQAPTPEAPSITKALELKLQQTNKK